MLMEEIETEPFYAEGIITYILGKLGRGKTDFAILLAEIAIISHKKATGKNLVFLTNIRLTVESKFIKTFKNDIELLELFFKFPGNKIVVFDEQGVFASTKRIGSTQSLYTEKLLVLIRKFKCSAIFIAQRDKMALPTIRDMASIKIVKHSKKVLKMVIDDVPGTLYNVPKASMSFNTYAVAYFEFILNFDRVLAKIANLEYQSMLKELKKIVNKPEDYLNK